MCVFITNSTIESDKREKKKKGNRKPSHRVSSSDQQTCAWSGGEGVRRGAQACVPLRAGLPLRAKSDAGVYGNVRLVRPSPCTETSQSRTRAGCAGGTRLPTRRLPRGLPVRLRAGVPRDPLNAISSRCRGLPSLSPHLCSCHSPQRGCPPLSTCPKS